MCGCCPSSTCVFCLLNIKFQKKKWIWIVTGRRWADCRPRVCPTDRFYEWSNLINISQHRRLQRTHSTTRRSKKHYFYDFMALLYVISTSTYPLTLRGTPSNTQRHTRQVMNVGWLGSDEKSQSVWRTVQTIKQQREDKTQQNKVFEIEICIADKRYKQNKCCYKCQIEAMASNVNLFCKTMTATRTLATQPDKQTMTFTKTLYSWERRHQILIHSTS